MDCGQIDGEFADTAVFIGACLVWKITPRSFRFIVAVLLLAVADGVAAGNFRDASGFPLRPTFTFGATMRLTPPLFRFILNLYGPYLGAGIRTDHISADWRSIRVSMKLRWYNRNAVGTHFGGSLYSMVDPHLMLMLMNILGSGYVVWDKSATIDFLRPGRGRVHADFTITDNDLEKIRINTGSGGRYLPQFTIDITDEAGELVARVRKTLYIRKKTG